MGPAVHVVQSIRPLKLGGAFDAAYSGGPARPGPARPDLIVELVRTGRVTAERIGRSVTRLLREKSVLGLFGDPYVDPDRAARICGNPEFTAAGPAAQSRSITVLKDRPAGATEALLPFAPGIRIYAEGLDPEVAARYATVVETPEEADVAVLRIAAPYDKERTTGFESFLRAGRIDFTETSCGPC
ncbi:hypothetical protein [Streptomyces sp. NPDC001502]|uniref:hypothetical protein n=1 Tax=Streptomyces sp. NPDC001502 TaxID=3364578 RepID=UPI0036944BBD